MPKITCICGEVINLSQIPHPQGFKIVSEEALETLVDNLIDAHKTSSSVKEFEKRTYDSLLTKNPGITQAYECPNCGTILIFANASDAKPKLSYQLEKTEQEEILSIKSASEQSHGNNVKLT